MTTVICIDGGVGRAITAIPALLKYGKNHPKEDWYVVVSGWDYMYWGIPELQKRTFNTETKGIFENIFWKADKVITPEPYKVPKYYRHEISLAEAFDIEINGSDNHKDLPDPILKLSQSEILKGKEHIYRAKNTQGKEKTIIIQPYGSTANLYPVGVFDESLRSIPQSMYLLLVENLMKNYNVIYFGNEQLHDGKTYRPNPDMGLREWAAAISEVDYFIGCDSCGQHFARAMNKNATVIIGGTHENNISYPDHFEIIKRDIELEPSPMRLSWIQNNLATRLNESRLEFTEEEIRQIYNAIVISIEGKRTKVKDVNEVKDVNVEVL
jgi:hypothetical protein